jgi:hypothetical protein
VVAVVVLAAVVEAVEVMVVAAAVAAATVVVLTATEIINNYLLQIKKDISSAPAGLFYLFAINKEIPCWYDQYHGSPLFYCSRVKLQRPDLV